MHSDIRGESSNVNRMIDWWAGGNTEFLELLNINTKTLLFFPPGVIVDILATVKNKLDNFL